MLDAKDWGDVSSQVCGDATILIRKVREEIGVLGTLVEFEGQGDI
jgi:hypothetical protein